MKRKGKIKREREGGVPCAENGRQHPTTTDAQVQFPEVPENG